MHTNVERVQMTIELLKGKNKFMSNAVVHQASPGHTGSPCCAGGYALSFSLFWRQAYVSYSRNGICYPNPTHTV